MSAQDVGTQGQPDPLDADTADTLPEAPHDPSALPADESAGSRSLMDDIEALFEDARTYIDAELSYQKTRAGFVADRVKTTIALAIVAAFLAVLATIGLTVGLIIALTPLITAWGATAAVVLGLLLIAYLLVRKAGNTWKGMVEAMQSDDEETPEDG